MRHIDLQNEDVLLEQLLELQTLLSSPSLASFREEAVDISALHIALKGKLLQDPDSPRFVTALTRLAGRLRRRGGFFAAARLAGQAVQILEESKMSMSEDYLPNLNYLQTAVEPLLRRGSYREALLASRRAVELSRRWYSEASHERGLALADALTRHAVLLFELERPEEAFHFAFQATREYIIVIVEGYEALQYSHLLDLELPGEYSAASSFEVLLIAAAAFVDACCVYWPLERPPAFIKGLVSFLIDMAPVYNSPVAPEGVAARYKELMYSFQDVLQSHIQAPDNSQRPIATIEIARELTTIHQVVGSRDGDRLRRYADALEAAVRLSLSLIRDSDTLVVARALLMVRQEIIDHKMDPEGAPGAIPMAPGDRTLVDEQPHARTRHLEACLSGSDMDNLMRALDLFRSSLDSVGLGDDPDNGPKMNFRRWYRPWDSKYSTVLGVGNWNEEPITGEEFTARYFLALARSSKRKRLLRSQSLAPIRGDLGAKAPRREDSSFALHQSRSLDSVRLPPKPSASQLAKDADETTSQLHNGFKSSTSNVRGSYTPAMPHLRTQFLGEDDYTRRLDSQAGSSAGSSLSRRSRRVLSWVRGHKSGGLSTTSPSQKESFNVRDTPSRYLELPSGPSREGRGTDSADSRSLSSVGKKLRQRSRKVLSWARGQPASGSSPRGSDVES